MRKIIALFIWIVFGHGAYAQTDYTSWDAVLKQSVVPIRNNTASQVNYTQVRSNKTQLKAFLTQTSAVSKKQFDAWAPTEQLAFLINAYNAWTLELVLTGYPKIQSIKELGTVFQSPWKKAFIPLFGKTQSLDDIEQGLIRGQNRYNEPRIHFALNCASIGCPALRPMAYRSATLDAQLDAGVRGFLADRTRNRFENGKLYVSSIFKWYRGDFEKGWKGATTLGQFLALYSESLGLSAGDAARLKSGTLPIEFLEYDWRLNKTP